MMLRIWTLVALTIAALSLGPSFAHVLEAPPRLAVWSPELWRDATVFNGQFRLFAFVGAPLDLGIIPIVGVLAYLLRHEPGRFRFALAGTVLFAFALAAWVALVAPANAVLATWQPGPVPDDFHGVRNRWETGHMAVAALKLLGFMATALAVAPAAKPANRR
ncbi:DUF1772 domain-containing protein [Microvirga subterranea]|uniref:DUF1772 domain-containing protein n=1 Tax=Microvirga subterranea TaxID=186651 RepID=A0A370HVQ5_9HYPH|nr:DUF1772 domain-containing protein [Microvirga subterranea]RDI62390.1 hypothetical protein DES45_101660 [Microvirga subterranea]